MLLPVVAEFFKFKIVGSVIVLTCTWNAFDQVKFTRKLSEHGLIATFSCDTAALDKLSRRFQGVLHFGNERELMEKTKPEHFSQWYKWLVVSDELPTFFRDVRYDVDLAYINVNKTNLMEIDQYWQADDTIYLQELFVHASEGMSLHPWAYWTRASGLRVTDPLGNMRRRLDFRKHPLRLITPTGHYSPETFNGTFEQFLVAEETPELDSAIRSAYQCASLLIHDLNGSEQVLKTSLWASMANSSSMILTLASGRAELGCGPLRILPERNEVLDAVLPVWPFSVGFTYLAERESSSNMYVEPFTAAVWWCCLGICIILAIWQKIAATKPEEKEGAYIGVLATWLQQDSGAVPVSLAGRWSFLVMSLSAMLVHAYYTSAIVSALMNAGRGGPDGLRSLADSRYAIASEDYDYMRYLFWDTETNRSDLEYLKRKKMTSKLYQDMKTGVELVLEGNTAYHTEYNQIYSLFSTFTDDQLCQLQYIDTITEQITYITTTKRGPFVDMFKSRATWMKETGLVYRIVSHLLLRPPPCRAALLAEQVKIGDIAPVLAITALGAVLSTIVLGLEILYAKLMRKKMGLKKCGSSVTITRSLEYDYVE